MVNITDDYATHNLNDSIHYFVEDEEGDNVLSPAQDKALFLLPIFSGLLSAWGSANIIAMYFQGRRKSSCYGRIMLGLSVSDLISSLTLALQAFLLPKETSDRIWASGNEQTCAAMGFFQQFALSAMWYNGSLSWFFVLTIRYSVEEERLANAYEPIMHLLSIGWPLVSAAFGVYLDLYHELSVGYFCWFNGDDAYLYAMIVSALPGFLLLVVVVPVNNILVYWHVRTTLRKTQLSTTAPVDDEENHSIVPPLSAAASNNSNPETTFSDEQIHRREQELEAQRQQFRAKRQSGRLNAVAIQSFLYVASFQVCYLPSGVLRLISGTVGGLDEAKLFPLLAVQAIFFPLQGLFNYWIYSRPSYLREAVQ